MVPRRRGWLLNVSSFASFQPAPRLAVYAATKAYVTSLSESLHEEVKGDGVVVTALCPGLIRTEFQSVSNTEHYQTEFPDFVWLDLAEVVTATLEAAVKGRAARRARRALQERQLGRRHHAPLAQAGGQRHGPAALTRRRGVRRGHAACVAGERYE